MSATFISSMVLAFKLCAIAGLPLPRSQSPGRTAPPIPYVDIGACPFEGCVYREWIANHVVVMRKERLAGSPIAYTVQKGERVRALTGVVVTVKAGRVQFREPIDLDSTSGKLHIKPGQTLFLLTYRGEGYTKAWFQGKVYEGVDGSMAFFHFLCERDPSRCVGKIVDRPKSVWWVRIVNARGQVGWTDEPGKFDGKDLFAINVATWLCTITPYTAIT